MTRKKSVGCREIGHLSAQVNCEGGLIKKGKSPTESSTKSPTESSTNTNYGVERGEEDRMSPFQFNSAFTENIDNKQSDNDDDNDEDDDYEEHGVDYDTSSVLYILDDEVSSLLETNI
jgi:hypothetical protein